MNDVSLNANLDIDELLGELAEEFAQRQRNGEQPDVEEYAHRYPQAADLLRQILPTLEIMGRADIADDELSTDQTHGVCGVLGDYRIVREIGRGGMGVVYQAEQISLGRTVALKVLPFAALLDQRQIKRFKNEALAAAQLDHPNIVDVYGVGCERSVHFYAMRYVESETLATVIEQIRPLEERGGERPSGDDPTIEHDSASSTPQSAIHDSQFDTAPIAALSTAHSSHSRQFFRSAAKIGAEIAQALDHAHQQGVVHRDIKPNNILIDAEGKAWITDFGLARIESHPGLTMSGDLLGTIRYMSPEQALAKRVVIDHRTDVYSLGVTLYELLTQQPAFAGDNRQDLLRRLAFEEPTAPRKLNRSIPAELETIVLKAMAKNPAERYDTAQALADDLQRYLDDKPIQARRPNLVQRAAKWSRRHNTVVWSATICLLVALIALAGSIGWTARDRAARQYRIATQVELILSDADRLGKEQRWPEALATAKRAETLIAAGDADEETQQSVRKALAGLKLVQRYQEARLLESHLLDGSFNYAGAERAYAAAFADAGLDIEKLSVQQAAVQLQQHSQIKSELVAALTNWARLRAIIGKESSKKSLLRLLAIADAIDSNPWRRELRAAIASPNKQRLRDLAESADIEKLSPLDVTNLGLLLRERVSHDAAARLLYKAQQLHPNNYKINVVLAACLEESTLKQLDKVAFLRVALALNPQSAAAHYNLGNTLLKRDQTEAAEASIRRAIELDPNFAIARCLLGNVRKIQEKPDEAISLYKMAIQLDPKLAFAHFHLGDAYVQQKKWDEAVAVFRKAIALDPAYALAHNGLGTTLVMQVTSALEHDPRYRGKPFNSRTMPHLQQKLEEAIKSLQMCIHLDRELVMAHTNLAAAYYIQERLDQAIGHLRRAIQLAPERPKAHMILGKACMKLKKYGEAETEFHAVVCLSPTAVAYRNLGTALSRQDKHEDAVVSFREAITLDSDDALAHYLLADTLLHQGKTDEAIASFKRSIAIDATSAAAHHGLGLAYYTQKKHDDAIACWRIVVQLDVNYFSAHSNLGLALKEQGKLDLAVEAFQPSIKLKPEDPRIRMLLGEILLTQKRYKEALLHLKEAVRHDPKSFPSAYYLGLAQYHTKDWSAALETLQSSCRLAPGDNPAWIVMCLAHLKLANQPGVSEGERANHRREARRLYEQSEPVIDGWVTGNPDNPAMQRDARFLNEARELLGIPVKAPKPKETKDRPSRPSPSTEGESR